MKLGRGLRANLALAGASLLAALLVFALGYEAVATIRYYRWRASFDNYGWLGKLTVRSPNPVLMWEYRPYGEAGGLRTNRWGFRDVDYETPAKPPGVERIAFIGDSITLGMGVVPRDTFVSRVGEMAARSGRPAQTLNFAVDGYNAVQIRELLTSKVLAFEPDRVVYVLCLNDFDFTDSSGHKIRYFRRPVSFFLQDMERQRRNLLRIEFHRYHFGKHRDEVFRALEEMRDLLAGNHADLLLAVAPVFPDKPGDAGYFSHYPLHDLHQEILRFAAEQGIPAHDLAEDFRRQPPPPERYFLDLWHLSAEGHRVVADGLWPRLRSSS